MGMNANSTTAPGTVIPYPCCNNVVLDSAASIIANSSISVLSNYADKHIARVNDKVICGTQAGILEKQISINVNQAYLNFSYAALLENAGHTFTDQPYVRITVFDINNNPIPGASLDIVASTGSPNPGFSTVTFTNNNTSFFYKAWTPVTINLSAYAGQVVTFQVIAAGCVQGGHGAEAYIDFDCGGPTAAVPNVWPGDANYDLSVDLLDVFYLGAGYGFTGTPRFVQGNNWLSSASNNWNQYSLYLADAKHADCDGNGIIDAADTVAIYQNYGLNHAFRGNTEQWIAQSQAPPQEVSIQSTADSVFAGESFSLHFLLNAAQSPVDSIYAIGFTLTYPGQMLANSWCSMTCDNSIISNTNYLNLFKLNGAYADLAITRNDQLNSQNAQGNIFSLHLVAAQLIGADTDFELAFSNLKAITRSGAIVPLTGLDHSVKFKASDATGVPVYTADKYSIYPNPVQNKVMILSPRAEVASSYGIYSVSGALIVHGDFVLEQSIDISCLENGCYFIRIKTNSGNVITKRFIKS